MKLNNTNDLLDILFEYQLDLSTKNRSKHNKSYIDGANFIINQLRNEISKKCFVPMICGLSLEAATALISRESQNHNCQEIMNYSAGYSDAIAIIKKEQTKIISSFIKEIGENHEK